MFRYMLCDCEKNGSSRYKAEGHTDLPPLFVLLYLLFQKVITQYDQGVVDFGGTVALIALLETYYKGSVLFVKTRIFIILTTFL